MIKLKPNVTCIHCWNQFPTAEMLWLSEHEDLKGDLLIKDQAIRFLPSRFNANGNAIDALGQECHLLACPNCHLALPRSIIERDVIFASILGSPQSGKSYYLASLVNRLREKLPKLFKLNFSDADLNGNAVLNRYEKELFLRANNKDLFVLGDLIPKTQLGGMLYNTVSYGNQKVNYPKPFSFNLDAIRKKKLRSKAMLCLYDNAGEHYEAGRDSNQEPGTRHMAMADFLVFVYDPTQDSRWRAKMNSASAERHFSEKTNFQEHILLESARRIRALSGIADGEYISKPLFVAVCKMDVWQSVLPDIDWSIPLTQQKDRAALDVPKFLHQSAEMKSKLEEFIPSIVTAAESVSNSVYYVPVSALGSKPTHFTGDGRPMISAEKIVPFRVDLPFIAGLAFSDSGLIGMVN
ncbi:MAG: hypothetical protein AB8B55_13770 [Mariniblastus sp.]